VISPVLAQLAALPTPLTPGEKQVLEFFTRHLPEAWEIYLQPHLNGLRPDFVLLHPENGIAVYEVKDWNLSAMDYFFEGNPPTLRATRGGQTFSKQAENPIEKVLHYKDEIHDLYCPSLPDRAGFGVITAGAILPVATSHQLKELFGEVYSEQLSYRQTILVGKEALEEGQIESIFPLVHRNNPSMTPEIAQELRSWLVEPSVSSEQREPLPLDEEQKRLVTTRTESGYRRIKGPAGSGKSLILAARAAELASEGKQVLVVTYNITLLNYLKDLAVRWSREGAKRDITWLNFHAWGKRICRSTGNRARYSKLGPASEAGNEWSIRLAGLMKQILSENRAEPSVQYDAILVDEGQDFLLQWWESLRAAVRKGGEMLLVADPTQDLFATARAWTDQNMRGAGFSGPWVNLERSYRLPDSMVPHARRFAETFLPADDLRTLPEVAQLPLGLEKTHLRWIQASEEQAIEACVGELLALPGRTGGEPLPWADVTFLAGNKNVGEAVVHELEARGIRVLHTFSQDKKQERRKKTKFFKGAPRVKATTIHSFRGWEGRALVVHLSDLRSPESMAAAYAALTRLKRNANDCILSVVSVWPELAPYGSTWPFFRRWPEAKAEDDAEALADFDLQWRAVMAALDRETDIAVEPGDEVMQGGRSVDLDLATICRGESRLHLVDDTRESAEAVSEALEAKGHRSLRVRPDEPELFAKILATVGT